MPVVITTLFSTLHTQLWAPLRPHYVTLLYSERQAQRTLLQYLQEYSRGCNPLSKCGDHPGRVILCPGIRMVFLKSVTAVFSVQIVS
ncbi:hypothetical protein EDB86DRAFT_2960639 [Lactarius hatsudake]|nr:hypothetical protein EDB86DRAFT_3001172 [Lactarius hatsudake]KAH8985041.1 hypothetical protein EDB86DRAFT_2960639 [Lactarius hatsudake]